MYNEVIIQEMNLFLDGFATDITKAAKENDLKKFYNIAAKAVQNLSVCGYPFKVCIEDIDGCSCKLEIIVEPNEDKTAYSVSSVGIEHINSVAYELDDVTQNEK